MRLLAAVLLLACARALPSCSITAFGALGDNSTDNTAAIQAAIASCDEVVVPAVGRGQGSVFLTRSLRVRSNLSVVIQPGATVIAAAPDAYPTDGVTRAIFYSGWETSSISNVSFGGGGTIDGQGWRWWARSLLNASLVRPQTIFVVNAEGVSVRDLTIIDSPRWTVYIRGDNMVAQNLRILNGYGNCSGYFHAPETDGINIGGSNIVVRDSYVWNGDDCVPVDTVASNVWVENVECHCGGNGAVPLIGPYYPNKTGVHNVTFRNMLVNNTNQGIGVKISGPGENVTGQGTVYNITWEDITIINPRTAAIFTNVYNEDCFPGECAAPAKPNLSPLWMTLANSTFRNIRATVADGQMAGCFLCSPGSPCTNLVFDNVTIETAGGSPAAAFRCFNVSSSTVIGDVVPSPCGA